MRQAFACHKLMINYFHYILRWNEVVQPPWKQVLFFLENQVNQKEIAPVAFVLMGTHFHLLSRGIPKDFSFSKNRNIDICFSEVIHPKYVLRTYKYIYQNPVRARLCLFVEDYPYHSLLSSKLGSVLERAFLKERGRILPYHLQSIEAELSWLNDTSYCAKNIYLSNNHP